MVTLNSVKGRPVGLYLRGAAVVDGSRTLCASAGVKVFNYRISVLLSESAGASTGLHT